MGLDSRQRTPVGPLQLTGRTHCDRIVVFDGKPRQIGQLLPVTIYDANAFTLFGSVVTAEAVGISGQVSEVSDYTSAVRTARVIELYCRQGAAADPYVATATDPLPRPLILRSLASLDLGPDNGHRRTPSLSRPSGRGRRLAASLGSWTTSARARQSGAHGHGGHDARFVGRDLRPAGRALAAVQRPRHGAEQPRPLRRGRPQSAVAGDRCSSAIARRCRFCCKSSRPASISAIC